MATVTNAITTTTIPEVPSLDSSSDVKLDGNSDVKVDENTDANGTTPEEKNGSGDRDEVSSSPPPPSYRPKMITSASSNNRYSFPLLYVSPCGTISVIFRHDVFVEMTVDKTIRVLCPGKFSAATNARGTSSCIMHPKARVYQADTHVYCELEEDKLAVFGSQGVIFTMKRLSNSYLVSSTTVKGTTPIRSDYITYPTLQTDFTMNLLYLQSICGQMAVPVCHEIVRNAKYQVRDDGIITVVINGILIKQMRNGDISVHNRPRSIRASPVCNTVYVRTHFVDMGVQEGDKAFVKRGVKRVHSSRSGMVVSDGNCITAMDHFGRIVSST